MLGLNPSAPNKTDEGHRVPPKILKKPTTYQSLTSTFQSISLYTSPGRAALSKQARRLSDGVPALGRFIPPAHAAHARVDNSQVGVGGLDNAALGDDGDDGDGWTGEKAAGASEDVFDGPAARASDSPCTWSAWDELLNENGHPRRVLIKAFGAPLHGLQVWDFQDLDDVGEILNARGSHDFEGVVAARILGKPLASPENDPSWASAPLLAVLCVKNERSKPKSALRVVSLRNRKVVKRIKLEGCAVEMKVNDTYVIISTYDPPALHIISSSTLAPDTYSPLLDVVPHPISRAPTFDIGRSRLLAYTTSRRMAQENSDGIAAGKGWRGHLGSDDIDSGAAQVGKVARLVGGSVVTGVRALGTMGYQYWNAQQPEAAPGPSPYSKSAPQPSYMPSARFFGFDSPPAPPHIAIDGSIAGHVIVVDLNSRADIPASRRSSRPHTVQPRNVAHFRPCVSPVALLSFNSDSTQLLTADVDGRSFHIFEIHPLSRIASACSTTDEHDELSRPSVWHRYRLDRGRTSACPVSAEWTAEGKFVAVATSHGTTHLYAVRPDGGLPQLENQFQVVVENPLELQPLSVPLTPLTRIRAPAPFVLQNAARAEEQPHVLSQTTPPSFFFLSVNESLHASPRLFGPGGAKSRTIGRSADEIVSYRDLVLFYPSLGHVVLARLGSRLVTEASPMPQDHRSMSGLTQMMRTRTSLASPAAQLRFFSSFLAAWDVARPDDWAEFATPLTPPQPDQPVNWTKVSYHWASQIEIDTYSRSTAILPRSIYLSHQFAFYHVPPSFSKDSAVGDFVVRWKPVKVRDEVEISEGEGGRSVPYGEDTALFGEPIRTAMDTFLDPQRSFLPASPSSLTPTFPNGVPGKHGRWNDSLPIRVVPPNLYDGFGRIRRELGRVATARRQSNSSFAGSVSFEDDDLVFTAPTSEPGSFVAPSLTHGASASDTNSGPLTDPNDEGSWAWEIDEHGEGGHGEGKVAGDASPPMAGHEPVDDDEWNHGDFAPGLLDEEGMNGQPQASVMDDRLEGSMATLISPISSHAQVSKGANKTPGNGVIDLVPPPSWSAAQHQKVSSRKNKMGKAKAK